MSQITRRKIIAGTSAISVAGLAGCTEALGPDPRVTDTELDQGFTDLLTGGGTIQVLVANNGATGDVQVTITFRDSADNALEQESKIVEIAEGDSRRVDFEVSPPSDAETYEPEVEPADGVRGLL